MSADAHEAAPAPLAALLGTTTARLSVTQRFGTAVPRQGLSPAGLRAFVTQHAGQIFPPAAEERADGAGPAPVSLRFEDLTTFQVVARVIKPATEHTGGSYAELLLQQVRPGRPVSCAPLRGRAQARHPGSQDARDAPSGLPVVGPATVFVSHAWKYPFADLVAALTARFDSASDAALAAAAQPYLWIDIFVGSQHKTESLDPAWWSNAFAQAIRAIGHTALVLQPWHAPEPLTRSWCLWEIFCTLLAGVRFEVLLPPEQSAQFQEALERRFDDIAAAMSRIDTRRASAFKPEDKAMIDAAVSASKGGFFAVNAAVIGLMREWLVSQSRALVAARISAHGEADAHTLTAKSNLARLLAAHGQLDEAVTLYSAVAEHREAALAATSPDHAAAQTVAADGTPTTPRSSVRSQREVLLLAWSALAAARGARGDLHAAVRMHRRVMRERRRDALRHAADAAGAELAQPGGGATNGNAALVESRLAYARALIAFCAQPARPVKAVNTLPLLLNWWAWPFRAKRWVNKHVLAPVNTQSFLRTAHLQLFMLVFLVPLTLLGLTVVVLNSADNVLAALHSLGYLHEAERLCAATAAEMADCNAPAALECHVLRATALRDQGRLKAAAKLLQDAAQSLEAQLGAAHVATCAAQAELADLQREQGDVAAAETTFLSLASRLAEQLGDAHPDARAARINVALCVACRGELAEAAKLLEAEKLSGAEGNNGAADDAMDTSAPGRLLRAGMGAITYVRDELEAKPNDNCDPETCENTFITTPCIFIGLMKPSRNERLGNIFRRVLLRHTRAWRRRVMIVVWTITAGIGIVILLGCVYLFIKSGFTSTIFSERSPPPPPPPMPPPQAPSLGRRLLR